MALAKTGSITKGYRNKPSGPPFSANAAENGLSVDFVSGAIVLGSQSPFSANLLNDRVIPMDGFKFQFIDGVGNNAFLYLDSGNRRFGLGDFFGGYNGSRIDIDDPSSFIYLAAVSGPMLEVDGLNFQYRLGEIGNFQNRTFFEIDDTLQLVTITTNAANNQIFKLDVQSGFYGMGDLSGVANGAFIGIDDVAGAFQIGNLANNMNVNINGVPGFTGTVTPVTTITVNNGIVTNAA